MNWYKTASLVDIVQTSVCTDNSLVLLINGKRYEYVNIPGRRIMGEIDRLKKWRNKLRAGQRLSAILKNIEKNLLKEKPNELV